MLAEEMGIVPSPVVAALEQAILRQDPELDGGAPHADGRPSDSDQPIGSVDADPSDLSWFPHDGSRPSWVDAGSCDIARRARAVVAEASSSCSS